MKPAVRTVWLVFVVVGVVVAVAAAAWQRARAVDRLPPDYDELDYLHAAYRYAERMVPGRWREIAGVTENSEHPPMVKLLYAVAVRTTGAPEPDLENMEVGQPMPAAARPAFAAGRWTSAVPGVAQVAVTALVHPLAGLLLAVEPYHAKYSAQAYLEGIPGLFFVLALLVFERATRLLGGARRPDPAVALAAAACALLGVAAAGKYSYGAVGALTVAPLIIVAWPRRPLVWLALAAAALLAFVALDPYLWPDPIGRLAGSVGYHFSYGQSEHVKKAALPWYQQLVWLQLRSPALWHPDLFLAGPVNLVLLPLAAIGAPVAARRRPVWAFTALVAAAFLLVWPVKWPQYLLLLLAPLAVCAAHAPAAFVALVQRVRLIARRTP